MLIFAIKGLCTLLSFLACVAALALAAGWMTSKHDQPDQPTEGNKE